MTTHTEQRILDALDIEPKTIRSISRVITRSRRQTYTLLMRMVRAGLVEVDDTKMTHVYSATNPTRFKQIQVAFARK